MRRLAILLLAVLFLLPEKGKSQEHYSLDRLLKHAVENSHAMKKALLQQGASSSKTKEAIANGLPQVEGSLNYSRMGIPEIEISQEMIDGLPEDLAPLLGGLSNIKALHTSSAGATVSQLLYSKSYLTGIKQARKAEELYEVMLQQTEEDVIQDVATTYYQILANKATLKILDENIEALEKLYTILKLQYENDFVKQTDVSRLKVAVTNLKTQRESLQNGIHVQKRVLKIITGIPISEEIALEAEANRDAGSLQPTLFTYAAESLSQYQLLQKRIELGQLQVASKKAAFYPNLAAFGQFTYSSYATEFKFKDYSNTNTIGLKATIPIFSSGILKQQLRQSQLKLEEDETDFDLTAKHLETNYQNASHSLLSAWSNLQDQKENKELAASVYQQVKLQFEEGMASLTDLLNVETSLLEAENLFNQQLLEYKLAEIDLLKCTGQLQSLVNN
jgi:outer membrane protein TolC